MEIITTVDGVRKQVKEWRKEGLSVLQEIVALPVKELDDH